jgi:hypothetical protein
LGYFAGATAAPMAVDAAVPKAPKMEAVCAFCETITAIVASPINDPKIATISPIPELFAILLPT